MTYYIIWNAETVDRCAIYRIFLTDGKSSLIRLSYIFFVIMIALQTELEIDIYERSYDRLGGRSERWLIKDYKTFVVNVISIG